MISQNATEFLEAIVLPSFEPRIGAKLTKLRRELQK
jgi:hypothetical protein